MDIQRMGGARLTALPQDSTSTTVTPRADARPEPADPSLGLEAPPENTRVLSTTPGEKSGEGRQAAREEPNQYQVALVEMALGGQSLNPDEMLALRSTHPAAYEVARQAETARQDLAGRMGQDPAHASQRLREALDEVTLSDLDETQKTALYNAVNDEFRQFAKQYDQILFSLSGRFFSGQGGFGPFD